MNEVGFSALLTVVVPPIVAQIVRMYGLDEKTATERFYASRLYEALSDESRKIWHYGPKTLFAMYDEEVRSGVIPYPEEAY